MNFEQILPYFLPPLLGAFIGYITNYIAIRMLFRPLRPWRILGIRVPLTPGIIPAKRGELAEKMGEMVGTHLLTSEDVGRTLAKESFRRELRGAVSEKLGEFLDRELGPAESLIPGAYRERFRDLVDLIRWKTVKVVFAYLESEDFESRFREYLHRKGDELLDRDLESFLTPHRYNRLRGHLEEQFERFLHSDGVARQISDFIDSGAEQFLASQRPLKELIPPDITHFLLAQVEKEVPPVLEKFGGLLYDPVFRDRLVLQARSGIESFLDSLEGFAGLISGFINMEKVYARIPEFLDKASGEISRWLREEKTQKQIAEAMRERIEKFLEKSPRALAEKLSYEKVSEIRAFICEKGVQTVRSPKTARMLLAGAEKGIAGIKDISFGDLADRVLPAGGRQEALDALAGKLLELLRSPAARQGFTDVLAAQSDLWLYEKPLGRLSARLPADIREELEEGIHRQLVEVLKREVPPLVESLNVHRMVAEKVNTLDILKVEGLLLGIMQEQFKYINLFGALLGFLIGIANIFFFILLR